MEAGSSEKGHSIEEDRLLKVKAVLLSTRGDTKAREDRNPEKRYLRGPMMTALAPECSKTVAGQRTREVTPIQRVTVQTLKCPDWDSMVGELVPGILTK